MTDIIAIVGPTGVGKTRLSIALAKRWNAEIISGDSMQFYKGLDIGTAKVTREEMDGVIHHLIDVFEPDTEFSVALYQEIVRNEIAMIRQQGKTVILVGGSGLYLSSVLYDYRFLGEKREEELEEEYADFSTEYLAELLRETAPNLASKTDMKNRRRVLRALQKSDEELDLSAANLYYENVTIIGLDMERERLYRRINERVDQMLEQGLLKEAKWLYQHYPDTQAAQAIGYKELFSYIEEKSSLEHAIEHIKKNSRHYAKRQLTWFRNKMDCNWILVDSDHFEKVIEEAIQIYR
ncbi:MAG: tRNA (adenosine(37)-N6)-dimethylallyltransferase MiaA [Bacilli bacterium]|nr:tRNA (adenosine(37)-N6)-dimethylallyltransferase MiaA [Bacilli bacterium]MBN2877416.1 tRNA (adenosine(37)-N6)-dimethylallyltransferase MiaA [Bacilli bacterium]